jgi:hypothetical protein
VVIVAVRRGVQSKTSTEAGKRKNCAD